MTFVKRSSAFLCAVALCFSFVIGSLSFLPKSFAVSDYEFPFLESEIPVPTHSYYAYIIYASSSSYFFVLYEKDTSFQLTFSTNGLVIGSGDGHSLFSTIYNSSSGSWTTSSSWTGSDILRFSSYTFGSPFFYEPHNGSSPDSFPSSRPSFLWSFLIPEEPISSVPRYWDYQTFFFPELPHGFFDGNINVVDGSYDIDFPSNASISGAITQTGNDHYSWSWNHGSLYWNGETVQGEHEGWISPDYQLQTPPNGDITQTAYANRLINLSLSDLDSVVNYTPAYNENSRFRCWSCVMDSSYVWFISDTRNKITGSIVSVTSDEVTWKYAFSDPQGGNTIYPTWAIVFSPMGEVIQVLSPTTVSNKNTYTLSCSIGTLEQDQDTGIWSCDPLYHGFWFSNDSPPVANITHLNVAEHKKYLANPVFGESAFQLNFLSAINDNITGLRSDLTSLQSAMQSSFSNQTSTFQNMDSPSYFDPTDVNNMLEYGSLESVFHAPSTDDIFSVDSGTFTDGMGFWRDRMNELLFFSGSPALAMTIFSLTLGLAVLIIGRRVSGGGAA